MRTKELIIEAQKAFEEENLKLAQTKIGHALLLDDKNLDALIIQFLIYIEKSDLAKAETILEEIIENEDYDIDLLIYKAVILNDTGKIEEAIKLCELIIEKDHTNYTAYSFKGMFNHNLGNVEEAYKDLNFAVENDTKNFIVYQNRGSVNLANYQFDEALIDFNRAIKLDKSSNEAKFNKAITLRLLGKHKKAIRILEKVNADKFLGSEDLVQAAVIYQKNDQNEKAIELVSKAIELDNTFARAHYTRFNVNTKISNYEAAKNDLDNALQYDDGSFRDYILNGYAHLYYKKNELEEAIKRANFAITENPEFHWTYLTLAEVYGKQDDDLNFIKNLKVAIEGGIGLKDIDQEIREKFKRNKEFKVLKKKLKK